MTLFTLALGSPDGGFWMPPQSSTAAAEVDAVFAFIYWVCVFFFALIMVLMTVFVLKYRARSIDGTATGASEHSTSLELFWSVIPLGLVVAMFWMGWKGFARISTPPPNAYEITVVASQWSWTFKYPGGGSAGGYTDDPQDPDGDEIFLRVPAGRPVKLVMRSEDVIHSFFVPEFRIKQDLVPGRYTTTWFTAPREGLYRLHCTEYCGTGHSLMNNYVKVVPAASFVEPGRPKTPEGRGRLTFKQRCSSCHYLDGKAKPGGGPALNARFGGSTTLTDGLTLPFDENYVRESLVNPAAKKPQGFDMGVMPPLGGQLSDTEIDELIDFLKSTQ